jgi:hypothetical protein
MPLIHRCKQGEGGKGGRLHMPLFANENNALCPLYKTKPDNFLLTKQIKT